MPDWLLGGVPWIALAAAWAICLAVSSIGFRRVDHFISLGYGFSIAAQAVVFPIVYRTGIDIWLILQSVLLFAYGIRLAGFLMLREASPSFGRELEASKQRSAHIKGGAKFAIWVSVSALYVTMYAPALLSLGHGSGGVALLPGIVVMAAGLLLESLADRQKSQLKAANPSAFVRDGLFSVVRSPNYLGEMLFWFGAFISGIGAYGSVAAWLIAITGLACIWLIMLGSARRLELKQTERYGGDPAYRDYVARVPVLFPLVPLYSLKSLRVYLG